MSPSELNVVLPISWLAKGPLQVGYMGAKDVGKSLDKAYRNDLERKGVEVTDQLAELVEKGTLRIFVPTRTIHTKLYILERADIVRVIQTSANLTATAQEAKSQKSPNNTPNCHEIIQASAVLESSFSASYFWLLYLCQQAVLKLLP